MENFALQLGEAEGGRQEACGAVRRDSQPDFSAPKETASSALWCVTGPQNRGGGKAPLETASTPSSSRVRGRRLPGIVSRRVLSYLHGWRLHSLSGHPVPVFGFKVRASATASELPCFQFDLTAKTANFLKCTPCSDTSDPTSKKKTPKNNFQIRSITAITHSAVISRSEA